MSDDKKDNLYYKHSNQKEMQAFLAKLRSKARTKAKEMLAVYNHAIHMQAHGLEDGEFKEQNAALYDLIITNTHNDTLVTTLNNTYLDKGNEARGGLRLRAW